MPMHSYALTCTLKTKPNKNPYTAIPEIHSHKDHVPQPLSESSDKTSFLQHSIPAISPFVLHKEAMQSLSCSYVLNSNKYLFML